MENDSHSRKPSPTEFPKAHFLEKACEDIKEIPTRLRSALQAGVADLCRNPSEFSRPAPTPPFPPGFRCHTHRYKDENAIHWFHILHKISNGELDVHFIGHQKNDLSQNPDVQI